MTDDEYRDLSLHLYHLIGHAAESADFERLLVEGVVERTDAVYARRMRGAYVQLTRAALLGVERWQEIVERLTDSTQST